jgi:hypothetical protein
MAKAMIARTGVDKSLKPNNAVPPLPFRQPQARVHPRRRASYHLGAVFGNHG